MEMNESSPSEVFPDDYYMYDKENIHEQYVKLPQYIKDAYDLVQVSPLTINRPISQIVVVGMGGSAFPGDLLREYLHDIKIPIMVVRDYDLPNCVSDNSLVFVISYSGNTEETLSVYKTILRRKLPSVIISSGGKLEEMARVNRSPFIKIPKGFQPRTAATHYLFFPMVKILELLKIIPSVNTDVLKLVKGLQKPDFKSLAISLSEKLVHVIPILYSSEKLYPIMQRFKTQINENAKVLAIANRYSELNHNEICGFEKLQGNYHIVTFKLDTDHRRIQKRMEITKKIIGKYGVSTTEIALTGDHWLTKIYSAIYVADLTASFLALRYRVDPSNVEPIEHLKKEMGPYVG